MNKMLLATACAMLLAIPGLASANTKLQVASSGPKIMSCTNQDPAHRHLYVCFKPTGEEKLYNIDFDGMKMKAKADGSLELPVTVACLGYRSTPNGNAAGNLVNLSFANEDTVLENGVAVADEYDKDAYLELYKSLMLDEQYFDTQTNYEKDRAAVKDARGGIAYYNYWDEKEITSIGRSQKDNVIYAQCLARKGVKFYPNLNRFDYSQQNVQTVYRLMMKDSKGVWNYKEFTMPYGMTADAAGQWVPCPKQERVQKLAEALGISGTGR